MKGFKCFGLFLLFSIMLGLSLSVFSDANALEYQVDTIPFLIPESPGNNFITNGSINALYEPFRIVYDDPDDLFVPKQFWYVKLQPNSGFTNCDFHSFNRVDNYSRSTSSSDGSYISSTVNFRLPYYDSRLPNSYSNLAHCNSSGRIENPDISPWNYPPYVFGNPNGRAWIPYRYETSGIYRHLIDTTDGFHAATKFDLSEIWKDDDLDSSVPDMIYSLQIPLGVRQPSSDLNSGTPIELHTRFYFDSNTPDTSEFLLGNSVSGNLTIRGLPYSFSPSVYRIPCNLTAFDNPNAPVEAPYYVDVVCSGTMPVNDPGYSPILYGFTLSLFANDYLWEYENSRDVLFDSFTVVTNGDTTPASEPFGRDIDGGNTSVSPGYIQGGSHHDTDFFSSLTQLFTFSAINPFAGLFDLFAGPNNCVNIPTIAGMLHASSSTICPFFDNSVRNIATPVFMLAGTMLLFGFFVRWLGASSGNFFDDSANESLLYNTYYDSGRDRSFRGFRRVKQSSSNRRVNK